MPGAALEEVRQLCATAALCQHDRESHYFGSLRKAKTRSGSMRMIV